MYSMVLMAALTTGTDMPDIGHRRGGGCGGGCYGGMGYGGCYGGGYARSGCYGGGGWGGCYGGGYGGGWGGCYGGGYARSGCYGGGMGWGGGYGGGSTWGGCYGGGYTSGGGYGGGYVLNGISPWNSYAGGPTISGWGWATPMAMGNIVNGGLGTNQSFYLNPAANNGGSEATIIVHLPANARLTIDGEATQSASATRTFVSPPLEAGKTYTYTLRGEMNRDGRQMNATKTGEVRAGGVSEVTLNFSAPNVGNEENNTPPQAARINNPVNPPTATPRPPRSLPTPPDDQ